MIPSEDNNKSTASLLTALVIGLAAGALLSSALAAPKGSEARQKLAELREELEKYICDHKTIGNSEREDPESDRPV